MDWQALRDELFAEARRRGWASAGVTDTSTFTEARERALEAVAAGRMEGMPWYTAERVEKSADLGSRHPWALSILALAWPYRPAAMASAPPDGHPGRPRGRVAAYACIEPSSAAADSADYHDILAAHCDALLGWIRQRVPGVRAKRFVDHGWAMDRAVAERAGIGFAGKHASIITREAGSYVLLAELLLSIPLPPSRGSARNCGSCRQCLPACPTSAIIAPGVIDARRCISYLTIEHRGAIPVGLRPLIGTWVFGCDLCQEACPINQRLAPPALEAGVASTQRGPVPFPDLIECLELDEAGFAARFHTTAIERTGREGLARNAAIALGNSGDPTALSALTRAAETDPSPVVREAASWAIARLNQASPREPNQGVAEL